MASDALQAPQRTEYVAVLRCQTWNVWPEKSGIEQPISVHFGGPGPLQARLIVLSYAQRSAPESYTKEKTGVGPLLWDGETPGLHHIRATVLKAPEDVVPLQFQYRNAHRGEVDICINFRFAGELPPSLIEALRATAYAIMSLLNLQLADYLTPAAPFQLRKVLTGGGGEMASTTTVAVRSRQTLESETLGDSLAGISRFLTDPSYGEKYRVALELYAAHFTEQQVRVRFILLVVAMEALSQTSYKHQVALDLLDRWKQELKAERSKYEAPSEEFYSLDDLYREIKWRGESSLGDGIRKLFAALPGLSEEERADLQRRAMVLYRKRSTLVHEGHLPCDELPGLEEEARELLEKLFRSAIEQSRLAQDPEGTQM